VRRLDHLDRAMREPRDLEDLIEVVEMTGRQVESITGSLRLRNDADITMARVMVAMGNKSSRDTARRVRDAARDRAAQGLNHGGRRCFGFTANGLDTIPSEAAEVAAFFEKFVAGASLASIVVDLNRRGIVTVTGAPWTSTTLRQAMQRSRHAGLASYKKKVVGKGQWPAIVSEETWRAAVALLEDPTRRTSTGNKAAYLLSGLAVCGVCGGSITSTGIKRSQKGNGYRYLYRCRPKPGKSGYCVGRRRDWVDGYVTEAVFDRFIRDDVADLLVSEDRPDAGELHEEKEAIRRQLDDAAASFARRGIDSRQLEIITKTLRQRLDEIAALTARPASIPVLREMVEASLSAAADERLAAVEAVWDRMTLDRRRAVVSEIMQVVLHPGGGGKKTFDPSLVEIIPKR
jgi:site-specific DNA recombinase